MHDYTLTDTGADLERPDLTDNQGKLEYDPTNGTVSDGDITLTVHRKPIYPTLREGELPRSAAEFTRLFAYGLPKDNFIYGGATPLKVHEIVDSDTSGTLYLVSVGPYKPPDGNYANVPGVLYDPTNGVVSAGQIYIPLNGNYLN
jgi:hypothetical protein